LDKCSPVNVFSEDINNAKFCSDSFSHPNYSLFATASLEEDFGFIDSEFFERARRAFA
jgi:hypothetical protein